MKIQPTGYRYVQAAVDTLVHTGKGIVHSITFSLADAAPTAGTITLSDAITETTPVIFSTYVNTTAFTPHTVILDAEFNTGLYLGFATTADVYVTVCYR
jgi:hypothetical protein